MAAFDAAMALHERQLNEALHQIYMMFSPDGPDWRPKMFTGSKNFSQSGIANVSWKIDAPPFFDLSYGSMQSAAAAIANDLWEQNGAGVENITRDDIHGLVSASMPTFVLRFGVLVEVKDERGRMRDQYYLPGVEANCFLRVSNKGVEFVVRNVTCRQSGQFYVESYILPAVQQDLQNVLSGFTIQPFSFNGVAVTAPSFSMEEGYILVAVNIGGKPTPPPARPGSWVSPYFSLMMSQELLQKVVATQYTTFSNETSGGDFLAHFYWKYAMNLVPHLTLQGGNKIGASFSLTGPFKTEVHLMGIPVPHTCTVQVEPPLTGYYELERGYVKSTDSESLQIGGPSISNFRISVNILSVAPPNLAFIAISIQMAELIERQIWETIRRDRFIPFVTLPTFSQNLAGVQFRLVPVNVQIVSKDGYIGIAGQLSPRD